MKVLYDFTTTEQDEINLEVGQVVKITQVLNDSWLNGKCNGHQGNFPQNFVEPINIPVFKPDERIFVGTKNFEAEMKEDLALNKGLYKY